MVPLSNQSCQTTRGTSQNAPNTKVETKRRPVKIIDESEKHGPPKHKEKSFSEPALIISTPNLLNQAEQQT